MFKKLRRLFNYSKYSIYSPLDWNQIYILLIILISLIMLFYLVSIIRKIGCLENDANFLIIRYSNGFPLEGAQTCISLILVKLTELCK